MKLNSQVCKREYVKIQKYLIAVSCLMFVTFSAGAYSDDDNGIYAPESKEVPSYTNADSWAAYDAFNQHLLDSKKNIYKTSTANAAATDRWNGAAAIWVQPTYWDMAMNAYKRAKAEGDTAKEAKYKKLCDDIFAGNKAQYVGFDFDDANENTGWFIYDDIMWWTITLARAYELFEVDEYLKLSEKSFGRVWYGSKKVGDVGSYDPVNGGMFWQWQPIQKPKPHGSNDGKMACINFPAVVAAITLYNNVPEGRTESTDACPSYQTKEQYLAKGKEIYAWGVKNLFNKNTGLVADSRHGNGNPAWTCNVYNQATFIGSSVLLYKATGEQQYLDNAILAANYTMNEASAPLHLLPFKTGPEQGIYTAIFAQYIAMLVYDCGQDQYIPFLKRNINYGWKNRDKKRNLIGGDYSKKQTKGAIESYEASGIPALMLLFPAEK